MTLAWLGVARRGWAWLGQARRGMAWAQCAFEEMSRMAKTTPTQRTLALCRKNGWTVAVTERWNPFAKIRQDLFGFIDLVALNGQQIIGIQTTVGDSVSKRIAKIRDEPRAAKWLESGGRIFVHGWRKLASSRKWECREIEITTEVLNGADYDA